MFCQDEEYFDVTCNMTGHGRRDEFQYEGVGGVRVQHVGNEDVAGLLVECSHQYQEAVRSRLIRMASVVDDKKFLIKYKQLFEALIEKIWYMVGYIER